MSDYAKQFGLTKKGWEARVTNHGLEKVIAMGRRMPKGTNSPWRNGPALKTVNARRQAKCQ